eukprot:1143886-Pelagomonas_calceolata.AAC.2
MFTFINHLHHDDLDSGKHMLRSKAAFVYLLTTRELRRHFGRSIQLNVIVGTVEQAEQPNYLAEGQTPL